MPHKFRNCQRQQYKCKNEHESRSNNYNANDYCGRHVEINYLTINKAHLIATYCHDHIAFKASNYMWVSLGNLFLIRTKPHNSFL